MKDHIPLVIGRQSSGEDHIVNLAALPHLFISYSHDVQLPDIFSSFIKSVLQDKKPVQFSLSLSSRLAIQVEPLVPEDDLLIKFTHKDYEAGKINTIDEYIKVLMLELKTRKLLSNKFTASAGSHLPLLVFIDDIFEIIMSQKKTSLSFIEMLITGAQQQIYFIMGSSGIYRNLLNQIIIVNPSLQKKLIKNIKPYSVNQPLGAELVMNPDGLLFFREREEKIHMRLYPINSNIKAP
ncbi:MAG TPA: hypothetical protein VLR49_12455 [Ferruginibacter sp.]|nr:hypothetical protein [Ferruginibacter sp.]